MPATGKGQDAGCPQLSLLRCRLVKNHRLLSLDPSTGSPAHAGDPGSPPARGAAAVLPSRCAGFASPVPSKPLPSSLQVQNATSSLKPRQNLCWGRRGGEIFSRSPCVCVFYSKAKASGQDIDHLDFKIVVEPKDSPSFTVILVASSRQEKAAWTSDISQVDRPRQGGDGGARGAQG